MDKYIDAHCHLQWLKEMDYQIKKAKECGVVGFICDSTEEKDWDKVAMLKQKYSFIYPTYGIHPWYIDTLQQGWDNRLENILKQDTKAHVGEIGLDKNKANLDLQEFVFERQLSIAYHYKRPTHIHCVRSWDRLLHSLKKQREKLPPVLISHCHHGNSLNIPKLIEYNTYFSYSSLILDEGKKKMRECVAQTPLDRILIETDAPDLTPNLSDLPKVADCISRICHKDRKEIIQQIYRNTKKILEI